MTELERTGIKVSLGGIVLCGIVAFCATKAEIPQLYPMIVFALMVCISLLWLSFWKPVK